MDAEAIETFDIHTFERAREFMKEDAEKIEKYIQPHTAGIILVELSETTEESTEAKARAYVQALATKGVSGEVVSSDVATSAWNIRRHSFSLVRDHHPDHMRAVPCIEDLIIPLNHFDTFVPRLVAILQAENLSYAYHGHIGDGSLRIIPLFDFTDPQVGEHIMSFSEKVFALVKELRGNMSADHSDGIIRSPFLRDFYGDELYDAFRQVKEICDPHNIMNPHKKTGGTKEKLLKALDTRNT
jgi:FAD/FMN-containing dehydrogenase